MQSIRWLSVLTAVVIITACFFTWVSVESKNFFIGGFFSSDYRYGEPGILQTAFCLIYIAFIMLNKIWSMRSAFFVSAFNVAWAIRNYIVVSACSGGVCPEKHTGLYTILIGSILMMVLTAFIPVKQANPA
jgi:hypothetical protein